MWVARWDIGLSNWDEGIGQDVAGPRTRAAGADGRPSSRWMMLMVVLVVTTVAIALMTYALLVKPLAWGEDGELELSIVLEAPSMSSNGSIGCRYTLTNVGDTDLRILPPWDLVLSIVGPDNRTVQYTGAVPMLRPYEDGDLITLRSGQSWHMDLTISTSDWELRANETYGVRAVYEMGEQSSVGLPHWRGEVWSDTVPFSVT